MIKMNRFHVSIGYKIVSLILYTIVIILLLYTVQDSYDLGLLSCLFYLLILILFSVAYTNLSLTEIILDGEEIIKVEKYLMFSKRTSVNIQNAVTLRIQRSSFVVEDRVASLTIHSSMAEYDLILIKVKEMGDSFGVKVVEEKDFYF